MRRTPRLIRNGILSLLVGILLGGAVAGLLFFGRGVAGRLATGESAYQAGLQAVHSQAYDQALIRFHEALLSAENVLKEMEEPPADGLPADQFETRQQTLGQAFWLKHRALKARGFTRLLIEHKPLPTFEGQAEGTPDVVLARLSALRLPDDAMRRDAVAALREAAYRLPNQADVLREAVATEIQIEPLQWNFIHAFATTLVELDPKDDRARYLVARLEYEQPVTVKTEAGTVTQPLPVSKRSRDRMLKGLEHLARLKELEPTPRWRTTYLEAQMHAWLVYHYRQQRKLDAELEATQRLRSLLLDAEHGALARATKEQRANLLSRLDMQAIYGLHQMALDLVIDESRRAPGTPDAQRPWVEQVQKVLDGCVALVGRTKGSGRTGEVADFLTQAALKAMPYLATSRPEVWTGYRDLALDLARQAREEKVADTPLYLRVAELLNKDSAGAKRDEALAWLEDGLRLASASNRPLGVVLPVHEAKLRLLAAKGATRESLRASLEALRSSKQEGYVAAAAFYEGVAAEREGRLELSRQLLEQALRSPRADLNRRAQTLLVPLYLTLELPDRALASLNELDRLLARLDSLSPEERNWISTYVRGPADVAAYRVQAHLLAAHQARQRMKAAGPKQERELAPLVVRHELEVKHALDKIPATLPAAAQARIAWAQYLLQWDRFDEASSQVTLLKRDHAGLLQTLQLEIGLVLGMAEKSTIVPASATMPPPVTGQVDGLIQAYLRQPKADPAARLVWLKWLDTTGRQAEVQKTLADPAFFADAATNPKTARVKTLATIYCGTREQTKTVLDAMPHDPRIDVALLQVASTMTEQQELLAGAVKANPNSGLFRAWSAALAAARGDHVEACKGFLSCLEYTRGRPLVRQGLMQTLVTLAQYNPQEARKLAVEGLQEYPSEPSLLLGFAFASLQLGEFGSPADAEDQVKDMATALKAFEAAIALENQDASIGPWVAAQFWTFAGRADLARLEALRTLERAPRHDGALLLAVRLTLDQPDSAALQACEKWLNAYRQLKPQGPEGLYWQGQLAEKLGKKNDALACYRELMEKHPRFSPAYAESVALLLSAPGPETLTACRQTLDRWRAANPNDPLRAQAEVRFFAMQGKLSEARQVLTQQLASLESSRQANQPIQPVSASSDRQRQQVQVTAVLCQGLMKAGRWDEAETWLTRGLEACPDHEACLALLGEVYVQRLNRESPGSEARKALARKAIDVYAQLYRRQKGQLLIGNNLAWLLVTEMHDAPEAYRVAQEVRLGKYYTKPLPGDQLPADFLDTVGLVYARLARPEQAAERVELFEAARRRYPQDARVFVHLGWAYLAAKEPRRAEQAFAIARNLVEKAGLSPERQLSLRQEIEAGVAKCRRG